MGVNRWAKSFALGGILILVTGHLTNKILYLKIYSFILDEIQED